MLKYPIMSRFITIEFAHQYQASDLAAVRELLQEYRVWLGEVGCAQGFERELANLPGDYAPPHGALLLAQTLDENGVTLAGVVALRRVDAVTAEIKRLYVRPVVRGQKLGKLLIDKLLAVARSKGYQRIVLDTLPGRMDTAIVLYREFGFADIAPYHHNPVAGTIFLGRDL